MSAKTPLPQGRHYNSRHTQNVGNFLTALKGVATKEEGMALDSASVADFMSSVNNQSASINGFELPDSMKALQDELRPEQFANIIKAALDGASAYRYEHGCELPPDVLESAFAQAYSTTRHAAKKHHLPKSHALDSASNEASDPLALQTNRAVSSILSTTMSACPFAMYLPFDIGSNEAKLVIVSHQAGYETGQYSKSDSLDGANSGDVFMSAERVHTGTRGTPSGLAVAYTGKLTKKQLTRATCDQAAGDLKLLKTRAVAYVNGQRAAVERDPGVISGSITIGSVTHTLAGTINNDTGNFSITVTASSGAPLGAALPVLVKSYIDFERDASVTPSIITHAEPYIIHANEYRGFVSVTPGAKTQMSNELGIDPTTQSMVTMQNHTVNERHYNALFWLSQLSRQNADTFSFDWNERKLQMNVASIFNDMQVPINELSQQMVLDTFSYGIKYGYVTRKMAGLISGLPMTIFEPSGIAPRPGVYRVGRLFGVIDIYYCPKVDIIAETSTASTMLFIGGAMEAARCPVVFGDAVAPIIQPLGIGSDMKSGFTMYSRNFTEVNPHIPSSKGCARLDVTNLI